MRKIPGGRGGTLHVMERGDPSPKRGRKYASSSAFLAWCRKNRRPKLLDAKGEREVYAYLLAMSPQEWIEMVKSGMLTGDKCIEVSGWLDKKRGPENLRKTKERVFLKNNY